MWYEQTEKNGRSCSRNVVSVLCAVLLCAGSLVASGCAGKKVKATEKKYVSPSDTIMLTYPTSWTANPYSLQKMVRMELYDGADDGTVYFGEESDFDAVMEDLPHYYNTQLLYYRRFDFALTAVSNAVTNVAGCTAIAYYGVNGDDPARGWVIRNEQMVYHILAAGHNREKADAFFGKVEQLIQQVRIHKLDPLTTDDLKKEFKISDELAGGTNRNILATGKALLDSRDVSVDNYDEALQCFRTVMIATYQQDPRPPEYEQALRLLDITRNFRMQAFTQWAFLLDQNIGMGRRIEAMNYARLILRLFPNPGSTFHDYAEQKLNEAQQLKFND